MYLDLGRWITGSAFVLEWTPEEASLLQDRPSLLQRQSTSQGNMGNSHQTFCMRLVLVSYVSSTLIFSCMFITIETINKIASDTPNHQLLGTRGPRDKSHDVSVYETCACVIHNSINLLSYII